MRSAALAHLLADQLCDDLVAARATPTNDAERAHPTLGIVHHAHARIVCYVVRMRQHDVSRAALLRTTLYERLAAADGADATPQGRAVVHPVVDYGATGLASGLVTQRLHSAVITLQTACHCQRTLVHHHVKSARLLSVRLTTPGASVPTRALNSSR